MDTSINTAGRPELCRTDIEMPWQAAGSGSRSGTWSNASRPTVILRAMADGETPGLATHSGVTGEQPVLVEGVHVGGGRTEGIRTEAVRSEGVPADGVLTETSAPASGPAPCMPGIAALERVIGAWQIRAGRHEARLTLEAIPIGSGVVHPMTGFSNGC